MRRCSSKPFGENYSATLGKLNVGGRWEQFVSSCPLEYEGNRGRRVIDVLGTATLRALALRSHQCGTRRHSQSGLAGHEHDGQGACGAPGDEMGSARSDSALERLEFGASCGAGARKASGVGGAIICKPDCPDRPSGKRPGTLGWANGSLGDHAGSQSVSCGGLGAAISGTSRCRENLR
jgi:hypothetical protein